MSEEKLKLWLGFAKAVVITGGIGFVGQWANIEYQQAQITMEREKQQAQITMEKEEADAAIRTAQVQNEEKYLSQYLEIALDENLEKRYRFARYFASLSQGKGYREGWNSYLVDIVKEREAKQQDLAQAIRQEAEAKSEEEKSRLQKQISDLEADLAARNQGEIRIEYYSPSIDYDEIAEAAPCAQDEEVLLKPTNSVAIKKIIETLIEDKSAPRAAFVDLILHHNELTRMEKRSIQQSTWETPVVAGIVRHCRGGEYGRLIGNEVAFFGPELVIDLGDIEPRR